MDVVQLYISLVSNSAKASKIDLIDSHKGSILAGGNNFDAIQYSINRLGLLINIQHSGNGPSRNGFRKFNIFKH